MKKDILIDKHAHALGIDLNSIRKDALNIAQELIIWVMFAEFVVQYNSERMRYQNLVNYILQLFVLVGITISLTLALYLHCIEWYLICSTTCTLVLQLMLTLNTTYHCIFTTREWMNDPAEWDKHVYTKLALTQTLSKKNMDKNLHILADVKKEIKKTKEFNKFLVKNKLANVLIISDTDSMKNINKSARNIKNVKLIKEEGTNIYDLFKYKNVIITLSSAKKIQNRILNEKN